MFSSGFGCFGLQWLVFEEAGFGLDLGSAVRRQQVEEEFYLVRLAGLLAVSVELGAEEGAVPGQEDVLGPGEAGQQGAAGWQDYLGGTAAEAGVGTGLGRQCGYQESGDLERLISGAGKWSYRPLQEQAGAGEVETGGLVDYIA